MRRRWRWFAITLGVVLTLWVLVVFSLQRSVLFPRYATRPYASAGDGVPGLTRLTVDIDDGQVEAWLLPGDGVSESKPGPAVIFAHGNAELIEYWTDEMARYRALGVSVLLPEYRGYGRSAGSPSEDGIRSDFVDFYDQLAAMPEVDSNRIVFHGRSLGGGAVCALARDRKPRALILQSTFTSVSDIAKGWLVPRFLVRDTFDNEEVLRGLDSPTFIVHGRHDSLIPPAHAERNHAAATDSQLTWYDADHNDCPPDWDVYWRDVEGFLRSTGVLD